MKAPGIRHEGRAANSAAAAAVEVLGEATDGRLDVAVTSARGVTGAESWLPGPGLPLPHDGAAPDTSVDDDLLSPKLS